MWYMKTAPVRTRTLVRAMLQWSHFSSLCFSSAMELLGNCKQMPYTTDTLQYSAVYCTPQVFPSEAVYEKRLAIIPRNIGLNEGIHPNLQNVLSMYAWSDHGK